MLKLYYGPGNASLTPHMLLEELGVPYELRPVDRKNGEQHEPAFRALNPNGLVPVLVDGDLVLYETAAICLHLCDTHPKAGLAPAVGTAERAHFYKWLVWLTNTLQSALITYFHPEHYGPASDTAGQASIQKHAQARIGPMLDQLEAQLQKSGGPWILGQQYTAVDPYVLMLGRWTRNFERPARNLPLLGAHLRRVLARPAVQRTFEQEELSQPLV